MWYDLSRMSPPHEPRELELCSVIVPTFNEVSTIAEVMRRLWSVPFAKEIIVVDDGSTDGTTEVAEATARELGPGVRVHRCPINAGKGAAVRTGYALAKGDIFAVQDADLELDPEDLAALVDRFRDPEVMAVYGSRFSRGDHVCTRVQRLANGLLTLVTRVFYGTQLTDMETSYKLFRRSVIEGIRLQATRFEFEPEVTAKVLRSGIKIHEMPIRYSARTRSQGKKIGWLDGVQALATLIKWRLVPDDQIRRR